MKKKYIGIVAVAILGVAGSVAYINMPSEVTVGTVENGSIEMEQGEYKKDYTVEITAVADDGYMFAGFEVDGKGTLADETILSEFGYAEMYATEVESNYTVGRGDAEITAIFEEIPAYTVNATANQGGSIDLPKDTYYYGEEVTITAKPNEKNKFTGFVVTGVEGLDEQTLNKPTISFEMPNTNVEVVANFEVIPTYTVTTTSTSGGYAKDVDGDFYTGDTVTLQAVANDGYEFIGWSSDDESILKDINTANSTIELVIPNKDINVTANFEKKPEPVYSSNTGDSGSSSSGSSTGSSTGGSASSAGSSSTEIGSSSGSGSSNPWGNIDTGDTPLGGGSGTTDNSTGEIVGSM